VKVKFLVQVSGSRDWKRWPAVGEVVDLAEDEAADLIRAGIAEAADKPQTANPEAEASGA